MNKKGIIYSYGSKKRGVVRFTQSIWKTLFLVTTRGVLTGIVGVIIIFIIFAFGPIARQEINYLFNNTNPDFANNQLMQIVNADNLTQVQKKAEYYDVGTHFSIIFPRIDWGSNINANISSDDLKFSDQNLPINHVQGSYFPGQLENINLYTVAYEIDLNLHKDSGAYLLSKLREGDVVVMLFINERYYYQISEINILEKPVVKNNSDGSERLNILIDQSSLGQSYKLIAAEPVEMD